MPAQVTLLVGTRKGCFLLESDADRRDWRIRGPFCDGWPIYHAIRDESTGALYAAAASEWHGAGVWRSGDDGETWTLSSEGLAYGDPKKTGSVYNFKNLDKSPVKDGVWYDYTIVVKDRTVTISLNGEKVNEYTEPADSKSRLNGGYIAFQCHDPKSKIEFRTIRVKNLDAKK